MSRFALFLLLRYAPRYAPRPLFPSRCRYLRLRPLHRRHPRASQAWEMLVAREMLSLNSRLAAYYVFYVCLSLRFKCQALKTRRLLTSKFSYRL